MDGEEAAGADGTDEEDEANRVRGRATRARTCLLSIVVGEVDKFGSGRLDDVGAASAHVPHCHACHKWDVCDVKCDNVTIRPKREWKSEEGPRTWLRRHRECHRVCWRLGSGVQNMVDGGSRGIYLARDGHFVSPVRYPTNKRLQNSPILYLYHLYDPFTTLLLIISNGRELRLH